MELLTRQLDSPIGPLWAAAADDGLYMLDFLSRPNGLDTQMKRVAAFHKASMSPGTHPLLNALEQQLEAYFKGSLQTFGLPLRFSGTPFQVRVWEALLQIPYGQTRSYMQQSVLLGNPKAIRAVAKANGDNCLALLVPCHRVIGADGSLTGYAGGLERKRCLLALERQHAGGPVQPSLF